MIRTLASVAGLLLVPATALATPTAIPYDEDFQTSTTTCDAAFYGDCPTGWEGVGENGSLEYVNLYGDAGIRITPGVDSPNGIRRVFEVDPADGYLKRKLYAWPSGGGTATLKVRVVFKDASGLTLDTVTDSHLLEWSAEVVPFVGEYPIPAAAATAHLFVGAVNGSTSATMVELPGTFEMNGDPVTPEGMMLMWPGSIAIDCDTPQSCPPDISCDVGEAPVCVCDPGSPPACIFMKQCSCVDASEAQSDTALGGGGSQGRGI